jgi:hypothetical protein
MGSYGGKVILTEGLFNIVTTVNLPDQSFITLAGAGPSATKLYLSNNSNCAMLAKSTPATTRYRCCIQGLELDGNKANNATGTYGIDARGLEGLLVRDVRLYDTKSHGLYGNTVSSVALDHVRAVSCGGRGFYLDICTGWRGSDISTYLCSGGFSLANCYECFFVNMTLDQDADEHSLAFSGSQRCHVTNLWAAPMKQYKAAIYFYNAVDCGVYNGSIEPVAGADANLIGVYFYASTGQTTTGCVVNGVSIDGGDVVTMYAVQETVAGTGVIANCLMTGCPITGIATPRRASSNYRGTQFVQNPGWIASGEVRTANGSFTAGAVNTVAFYWNNPEKQDILVRKVTTDVTTASTDTGACIDIGIADSSSGTNLGTEFFDDLPTDATGINCANAMQLCEDSTNATDAYVVGLYVTEDSTKLVGTYSIEYQGR